MKLDKKIVICGAIRDCEKYLNGLFNNFKIIIDIFSKVDFVFIESDSNDNTLEKLKQLCIENNLNYTIISLGKLEKNIPHRTHRIAIARNTYLDYVEQHYSSYDYVLVMDMDDVNSNNIIKKDSIISNFSHTDWDMICSNQPAAYYDLWALRHDEWMPYDCWRMVTIDRPFFMDSETAYKIFISSRFIKIDENQKLIKVKSAFGGMAFIKISSIGDARHTGIEDNYVICEWVPFCRKLAKGNANIFINPSFVNTYDVSNHVNS